MEKLGKGNGVSGEVGKLVWMKRVGEEMGGMRKSEKIFWVESGWW